MKKFRSWFSPKRRQLIQLAAASLAPLAMTLGLGSDVEWTQGLLLFGGGIQFVANLTSLINVRVGDLGAGWAVVRGAVYSLGATAAPAFVTLGIWSDSDGTRYAGILALALALVGNVVAIITNQGEQVAEVQGRHELLADS
jgi:hypothetical protein